MRTFHPFSLRFKDPGLESRYRQSTLRRTMQQGRTAILVGIFVYLLCGLLDVWFASEQAAALNWLIRLSALCIPVVVLALSSTRLFERYHQPMLVAVCLAAGAGIIGIQGQVDVANAPYYYPMLILLTFFTYNFIGVRFVPALAVDLCVLVSYNLFFWMVKAYPPEVLAAHNIFIISANLIGGTAGFLSERNKRILYLRGLQLEDERNYHFRRSIHDPMTGLPNRELLYDRIRQAMARSQRDGSRHCGLFVDLDGFKAVNDQYGHEAGDQVLRLMADRLTSVVREADTVARIGGDEFFVLAQDVASESAPREIAGKILEVVNRPLPKGVEGLSISASIGVCPFPFEGMTVEGIIRRADDAMYETKNAGKNHFSFAGERKAAE